MADTWDVVVLVVESGADWTEISRGTWGGDGHPLRLHGEVIPDSILEDLYPINILPSNHSITVNGPLTEPRYRLIATKRS